VVGRSEAMETQAAATGMTGRTGVGMEIGAEAGASIAGAGAGADIIIWCSLRPVSMICIGKKGPGQPIFPGAQMN